MIAVVVNINIKGNMFEDNWSFPHLHHNWSYVCQVKTNPQNFPKMLSVTFILITLIYVQVV